MRTTIDLDDDTCKAIERIRRTTGAGLSETVNQLIRQGLLAEPVETAFEPIHRDLGLAIDVSNIGDALETLETPTAR